MSWENRIHSVPTNSVNSILFPDKYMASFIEDTSKLYINH